MSKPKKTAYTPLPVSHQQHTQNMAKLMEAIENGSIFQEEAKLALRNATAAGIKPLENHLKTFFQTQKASGSTAPYDRSSYDDIKLQCDAREALLITHGFALDMASSCFTKQLPNGDSLIVFADEAGHPTIARINGTAELARWPITDLARELPGILASI